MIALNVSALPKSKSRCAILSETIVQIAVVVATWFWADPIVAVFFALIAITTDAFEGSTDS